MESPGPPDLLPYNCIDSELIPKEEVEEIAELSPYLDPPEEFMLEDGVFIVEKIVNKRIFGTGLNRRTEYLIKWKDFPNSQNTWEPLENLRSCPLLIQQYENKYNGIIQHPSQTQTTQKRKRKRKRLGSGSGNAKKSIKAIDEILGATDCSGELMFYVKFKGPHEPDIIPSKIVNIRNPQAVIRYYESIISKDNRALLIQSSETSEDVPMTNGDDTPSSTVTETLQPSTVPTDSKE